MLATHRGGGAQSPHLSGVEGNGGLLRHDKQILSEHVVWTINEARLHNKNISKFQSSNQFAR
jgi:hypothetical protein